MAIHTRGVSHQLRFASSSRQLLPIFAIVLLACSSDVERAAAEAVRAKHVILLSLDTFRADAAGWLGDPARSLTPVLDAFARDSVVFTRARAQIPFTQPSHMSMFTGLYPLVHRVNGEEAKLHHKIQTLPQILHDQGFSTHGYYVNYWMKGSYGFSRGFDRYEMVEGGATHADHLNAAAFSTLQARVADGRRLFLFVQYFDPHSDDKEQTQSSLPYYSPKEFREGLEISDPDATFCDAHERCATQFIQWLDLAKRDVSPETVAQIRALYDAGIRYLDSELGNLFARLKTLGIYDDALIIVTSDHGEEFREHGKFLHDNTYEENIAIPLVIKFPKNAHSGRVLEVLAESVDILPSVLDHLGFEVPSALQGRSLLPSIRSGAALRDYSFSQDKSRHKRFSLADARYKLIYDTKRERGQLFDLVSDPGELRDIASTQPARFEEMKRQLTSQLRSYRMQAARIRLVPDDTAAPTLSDQEKERLRGIGYLLD